MPIFRPLIELMGIFTSFIFGTAGFPQTKLLISFFGLLLTLIAIGYWLYLEKRYGYGREWWGMLFRYFIQARLSFKQIKSDWQKVKGVFLVSPTHSVFIAYDLFETVIDFYGYPGKTLREKLAGFPSKLLPNMERLKKALVAIELIENKNPKIEITKTEAEAILKEIEKAFVSLLLLTQEDCWVVLPELPKAT